MKVLSNLFYVTPRGDIEINENMGNKTLKELTETTNYDIRMVYTEILSLSKSSYLLPNDLKGLTPTTHVNVFIPPTLTAYMEEDTMRPEKKSTLRYAQVLDSFKIEENEVQTRPIHEEDCHRDRPLSHELIKNKKDLTFTFRSIVRRHLFVISGLIFPYSPNKTSLTAMNAYAYLVKRTRPCIGWVKASCGTMPVQVDTLVTREGSIVTMKPDVVEGALLYILGGHILIPSMFTKYEDHITIDLAQLPLASWLEEGESVFTPSYVVDENGDNAYSEEVLSEWMDTGLHQVVKYPASDIVHRLEELTPAGGNNTFVNTEEKSILYPIVNQHHRLVCNTMQGWCKKTIRTIEPATHRYHIDLYD